MSRNITNAGGSFIGTMGDFESSTTGSSTVIHILDKQTDRILDDILAKNILDNEHYRSLKDTTETFEFVTFADKRFSPHLEKRNKILIPDEDRGYAEFIITNSIKIHERESLVETEIFADASYLELKKTKVIYPETLTEYTVSMHAGFALDGSAWQIGRIESNNHRTITIESHTNPYAYLKRIANEFDLEINFRIEVQGNRIVGRYVDLLDRIGTWQGVEVEFGKNLDGIRRNEDTKNLITALIGLGPEPQEGEDGNVPPRMEVYVEDNDALDRWGFRDRNGEVQHLVDYYEVDSTDENMTIDELRQYTRTELEKRVKEFVEYEGNIHDLEHIPGLENYKLRFGDTIRIKDTYFNPPLYLEARVHSQRRNIKDKKHKRVTLGDYEEFTEEQVTRVWQRLQWEIQRKIDFQEMSEYTYKRDTIDEKDIPGNEAKGKIDTDIGTEIIESTEGSQNKADGAESNSNDYTDNRMIPIEDELSDMELALEDAELAIEDAEIRLGYAENALEYAQDDILQAQDDLDILDEEVQKKVSDEDLIPGVLVDETGVRITGEFLEVTGDTLFRGSISAPDATFLELTTRDMIAINAVIENSTITGTLNANDAIFQSGRFDEATIVDATIQNATITGEMTAGEIIGVNITGAEILQEGTDGSIILNNDGFVVRDEEGYDRILMTTTLDGSQGFYPSLITFEPNQDDWTFYVGTGGSGLGDGYVGFATAAEWERTFFIANPGGKLNLSAREIFSDSQLFVSSSAVSGGIALSATGSETDFYLNHTHVIAGHNTQNYMVVYPQRYNDRDIFRIRSHNARSDYQNDLRLNINGNLMTRNYTKSAGFTISNGAPSENHSSDRVELQYQGSGGDFNIITKDSNDQWWNRITTEGRSSGTTHIWDRIRSDGTMLATTGNSANVHIFSSSSRMSRVTSASRYKIDAQPIKSSPYNILKVFPLDWYDKSELEEYADKLTKDLNGENVDFNDMDMTRIRRIPGLIAEDVEAAGLYEYVEYNKHGELDGIFYDRLWTLLIPITKDHNDMLIELRDQIEMYDQKLYSHDERLNDLTYDVEWLKTENTLLKKRMENVEKGAA